MPRISFKKSEHAPVDLHEAAIVGRSEQHANVVVKDNRLSRAHCKFEPREDGTWAVLDLESQNGTFLNGRRVKESLVRAGDVVTIGACDIVFETTGGPGASTVMKGVQTGHGASTFGDESELQLDATNDAPDSTRTVVAPAALVLVNGTLTDKIHPITSDEFTIGRKKDNQLCLSGDAKASSHHARIRRDGMSYFLEDLNSMNGVTVNGVQIREAVSLRPGNKVGIGLQVFEFQLQGRPRVSSGETAPLLARKDIESRRLAAVKVGDDADDDADEDVPVVAGDAAGETALHDKAAMTQKVARVSSGTVFGFIEVLVVLVIAAGVLYAGWVMTQEEGPTGPVSSDGSPAARDGGLLTINPSFDERDEGGFPKGWRYEVAGTDSFGLVEGARGGQYALQIARFSPGNAASYVVSTPMDVQGARGIKASVFAVNSEHGVGRFGSAVLALFWFEHTRDRDPILVTPLAFKTRISTWTELVGSAAVPSGARAFSVAVGICGASGSVAFDDTTVERDDAAPRWWAPWSVKLANGLSWDVSEDGSISLTGAEGVLLRGGRLTMHQADGRADPLDALTMLTQAPTVQATDNRIAAAWDYYDPLAEKRVRLNLELAADGNAARLTAGLAATADGQFDNASRRVALHALATPAFMPAELLRFEGETLMESRHEILDQGGARKQIGSLLAAGTGSGNRVSAATAAGSGVQVTVRQHPQGREMFLQHNMALVLNFSEAGDMDELRQLVALLADVQQGEDQADRIARALEVFSRFPYCEPELVAAAAAIDSAAKDYKLRLVELRDGINVPQLTRNERLYRSAMEQAIHISTRLGAMRGTWEATAPETLSRARHPAMGARSRSAAERAHESLRQLVAVSHEFSELELAARQSLFMLEIDIQQRDAHALLVSARDFLDSGQYVQGMLKLRTVVTNYPRCLRGIEAKERLVDAAELILNESAAFSAQGLRNIATDRGVLARSQLNLVESRLLANVLSPQEALWLSGHRFGDGAVGKDWLDRELLLARRMLDLRARLPGNLPPEAAAEDGEG